MVVEDNFGFHLCFSVDMASRAKGDGHGPKRSETGERSFDGPRVLKWVFPECPTEPTRNEIRSRSFSRVQLRPRRVLRHRQCHWQTCRIYLAPIRGTRKF